MAKNVSPARDPDLTELPGSAAELIIELEAAQPGEIGEDTAATVLTVYIDVGLTVLAIIGLGIGSAVGVLAAARGCHPR
jgi:hypothetical protein